MKICKQCGNLVSDNETMCSKCGVATEIVYVNQAPAAPAVQAAPAPQAAPAAQLQVAQTAPVQQTPVQQVQPAQVVQTAPVHQVQAQPVVQQPVQQVQTQPMMQQPVQQVQPQPQMQAQPVMQQPMQPAIQIQAPVPQSSKLGSFFQKNSKAIIVALLVLLVVGGAGFGITQVAFKDREESKPVTDNKDKFQLSDNDPSNKVEEPTDNPNNNNQPALETYKKVSQNYMFTIPNAYVSSVQESAGGLTLLNLDTGSNVWIGINVATLDAYRTNKAALKTSYESQGRTVLNMYDKVINNKDALILELISNEQKTLLAITQGPSTECFIITINNTTNKDEYDYTALSDMLGIIGTVQKVN